MDNMIGCQSRYPTPDGPAGCWHELSAECLCGCHLANYVGDTRDPWCPCCQVHHKGPAHEHYPDNENERGCWHYDYDRFCTQCDPANY